jgi:pyridoxamine 5'-phosphate oxidase
MPPLDRPALSDDPIEQFGDWFARAQAEVPLPDAVCLATVDGDGAPDARMVLLKGFDSHGFRFHTNYASPKAGQLEHARWAALVFYWPELDRQVRVRGTVERLSAEESDGYFTTRPRERQLSAWASPQSRVLRDRAELDLLVEEAGRRFEGTDVPRPDAWGGYLIEPEVIEFWQGQVGRLHDRFRYSRDGEGWRIERLAP